MTLYYFAYLDDTFCDVIFREGVEGFSLISGMIDWNLFFIIDSLEKFLSISQLIIGAFGEFKETSLKSP
jgi:hypothetical protein